MPTRTVVKLRTRLRNQKMLTRMMDGDGVVDRFSERGCEVEFVTLSRRSAIRARRMTDRSVESARRDLHDSTTKAVTTAENRPAYPKSINIKKEQ